MKLQPCSPSFFDARVAIPQADEALTGSGTSYEISFVEDDLGLAGFWP